MDILTNVVDAFSTVISPGRAELQGVAHSLLHVLAGIDLTLAALWWALRGDNFIPRMVRKIFVLGVFAWFISEYDSIMATVIEGFVQVASIGSGKDISQLVQNPGYIFVEGFNTLSPLFAHLASFGISGIFSPDMYMTLLAAGIAIFAFGIIAITLTVTWIEYYLLTALALVLLPFGVWRHTAFLAERAFSLAITFGIKIMVLGFIVAIAGPVILTLVIPEEPSWGQMLSAAFGVLSVAALAVHAPGLASGILAGSPSLSSGAFQGVALPLSGAAAASGAIVGGAALGAGRVGLGMAPTAVQAVSSATGKLAAVGGQALGHYGEQGGGAAGLVSGGKALVGATGRGLIQSGGAAIRTLTPPPVKGALQRVKENAVEAKENFQASRARVHGEAAKPFSERREISKETNAQSGPGRGRMSGTRPRFQSVRGLTQSLQSAGNVEARPETSLAIPIRENEGE